MKKLKEKCISNLGYEELFGKLLNIKQKLSLLFLRYRNTDKSINKLINKGVKMPQQIKTQKRKEKYKQAYRKT